MKTRLILVGTEGEANLGMTARLVENFCINELYLVTPQVDIGEEAFRYAVKGANRLREAVIVTDLQDALEGLDLSFCSTAVRREDDLLRKTLYLNEVIELISASKPASIGIVFGRESTGLTRKELSMCDYRFTINTCPDYPTLNLANSIAITLYNIYQAFGKQSTTATSSPEDFIIRRRIREYLTSIGSKVFSDYNRLKEIEVLASKLVDPRFLDNLEARILLTLLGRVSNKLERCNKFDD